MKNMKLEKHGSLGVEPWQWCEIYNIFINEAQVFIELEKIAVLWEESLGIRRGEAVRISVNWFPLKAIVKKIEDSFSRAKIIEQRHNEREVLSVKVTWRHSNQVSRDSNVDSPSMTHIHSWSMRHLFSVSHFLKALKTNLWINRDHGLIRTPDSSTSCTTIEPTQSWKCSTFRNVFSW